MNFNRLISFGNYLLSPERKERFLAISTDNVEERLSVVHDADIQNWKEENLLKFKDLSFGEAIECAKLGMKVARSGWNGAGMYAYIVPAASYPAQTEIAKKQFGDMVPYREYWALKTAQNDIATWAPSGSDSLAEDWMVIN